MNWSGHHKLTCFMDDGSNSYSDIQLFESLSCVLDSVIMKMDTVYDSKKSEYTITTQSDNPQNDHHLNSVIT
jgi:hypothetical protein